MRLLKIGSTGPAVQLLQLALNRAGCGPLNTDGIFGPGTEAALRRFQASRGIPADGVAGNQTHRAILPWYLGYITHPVRRGTASMPLPSAMAAARRPSCWQIPASGRRRYHWGRSW